MKGIVIYSGSKDVLGRALTNPTHFNSKNSMATSIARGGLGPYSCLSGCIRYAGGEYLDVEHAYHILIECVDHPSATLKQTKLNFMSGILKNKFLQYPILFEAVKERGGVEFLKASIHVYNADADPATFHRGVIKNDFWTSSGEDKFMLCLTKAYQDIHERL